MKYLDAFLARETARVGLTKPTKVPPRGPVFSRGLTDNTADGAKAQAFVGFVSDLSADSSSNAPAFRGGADGTAQSVSHSWRVPLTTWPIPWREAWGRHANFLEEEQGLLWREAEQQAQREVARLKQSGDLPSSAPLAAILAALEMAPRALQPLAILRAPLQPFESETPLSLS